LSEIPLPSGLHKKKASSDIEEDKSYALLGFLVNLIEGAGSFTDNSGDMVKVGDHVYVVGGAVRNFVIGKPVKDIDIVIDAIALSTNRVKRDAAWFAKLIIKEAPFNAEITQTSNDYGVEILHIHGDWEVNGVNVSGQDIEIAFARKESYAYGGYTPEEVEKATIQEDAKRREFTFNTLLWSFADLNRHGPSEEIIQDPLGTGLKDLKNNIIDTPLDPEKTFEDDASRMMRALKFQYKYGFEIAPRVQKAIEETSGHIRNVPSEVLYTLLTTTILNQSNYKQALEEMRQNNLLREVIAYMDSKEAFRVSIKNWAEDNRDLVYMFNLLDYNLPIGDKVGFMTDDEKSVFRKNILSMPSQDHYRYLELVKNIGPAIKDKSFFMSTFRGIMDKASLSMSDIPVFRIKFYEPSAREVALSNPSLINDPESLRKEILISIESKIGEADITEASIEVDRKLIVLSEYFKKTNNGPLLHKVGELVRYSNFNKFASEADIQVPNLSGDVYIFDMDDTLFWSPEWHTLVDVNEQDEVTGVNMDFPNIFYRGIEFVNNVNNSPFSFLRRDKNGITRSDLEESFGDEVGKLSLGKEVVDIPFLGKENQTIFVLMNQDRQPISIESFKKYFSSKYTKIFDLRGKYVKDKVVIGGDYKFYQAPETLGHMPNEEVFNIYKEKSSNAIILTARETAPGMEDGIRERILSAGGNLPVAIFTKPSGASSGKYKGHVIGKIASQESVGSVTFYDDNLKYITDVNKVLINSYGSDALGKVNIIMVSVKNKPANVSPAKGV